MVSAARQCTTTERLPRVTTKDGVQVPGLSWHSVVLEYRLYKTVPGNGMSLPPLRPRILDRAMSLRRRTGRERDGPT